MNDDRGKYDHEMAAQAEQEFLHECARRDMDQGIRPTYWDEPEEEPEQGSMKVGKWFVKLVSDSEGCLAVHVSHQYQTEIFDMGADIAEATEWAVRLTV
jgi:hypothetical protein